MAVSLSLANHHASLPVAWRLYLPKERAADLEHRRKAGVPDEIDFKPSGSNTQYGCQRTASCKKGSAIC